MPETLLKNKKGLINCNITQVATLCNRVNCDAASKLINRLNVNFPKAAWLLLQDPRQIVKTAETAISRGFLAGKTLRSVIGCNLLTFFRSGQVNMK